ncbi:MAG TPA: FmdB family zinc ribbon protein [Terriglobia bacterium]|nr:FmdB family zinc ribbon protein [Terriglobia bacterium]
MPLYEYRCAKCGEQFEKIRKFSDPPLTKCEKCGGKLEHLIASPAFKFKGTGWYVTDYGKKDSSGAGDKSDRAGSEKKESTPADKGDKPSTSGTPETKGPSAGTKGKDSKLRIHK